jgi:hypothetical protein
MRADKGAVRGLSHTGLVSEENVRLVREGYEAFSREGEEAILEYLDPEIEVSPIEQVPGRRTYRGHDGFLQYLADTRDVFGQFGSEATQFDDPGGQRRGSHPLLRRGTRKRGAGGGDRLHRLDRARRQGDQLARLPRSRRGAGRGFGVLRPEREFELPGSSQGLALVEPGHANAEQAHGARRVEVAQ